MFLMLRSEYMAGFVVGENLSPDFNDKRENCISIGQLLAEIRYFGQEHRQHQIVSLQKKKKKKVIKKIILSMIPKKQHQKNDS